MLHVGAVSQYVQDWCSSDQCMLNIWPEGAGKCTDRPVVT